MNGSDVERERETGKRVVCVPGGVCGGAAKLFTDV